MKQNIWKDTDLTEGDNLDQLIFLFEITFTPWTHVTCILWSLNAADLCTDISLFHVWVCNIYVHIWCTYLFQWNTFMTIDLKPEMLS